MSLLEKNIFFNGIAPFVFQLKYAESFWDDRANVNESHIHQECEIYLNITGDISFMVEGTEYPVTHGEAIITRPYEYHHCVYKSKAPHAHFWILFSAVGNESILGAFYNREAGINNLIKPPSDKKEVMIDLCNDMMRADATLLGQYAAFTQMIDYIGRCEYSDYIDINRSLTNKELSEALKIIDSEYGSEIDVGELSKRLNISVNTLERYFKRHLNMTPHEYIVIRRLAAAARLLKTTQLSVLSVACECGWNDCSYFIERFKRKYNATPTEFRAQK